MDPTQIPIELKKEILSYIMHSFDYIDWYDWELEEIYDCCFGK